MDGYVQTRPDRCCSLKYEPEHDKTNTFICVTSEDSDQTGQPPSLITVFVEGIFA